MPLSTFTAFTATAAWFISVAFALDNGLAQVPQLGWDNWNAYACNINETVVLRTARNLVDYGYLPSMLESHLAARC